VVFHLSPTIQSGDLTDLDLVEHIEIETGTNGVERAGQRPYVDSALCYKVIWHYRWQFFILNGSFV